jgi:hypothetical protein
MSANRTPQAVTTGTMLLRDATNLPDAVVVRRIPYCNQWSIVQDTDCYGLDRLIRSRNWSMICVAGGYRTFSLGRGAGALLTGVLRLARRVSAPRFNGMQLDQVAPKRFWGVIPYISVHCHAFQIQPGLTLAQAAPAGGSRFTRAMRFLW